MSSPSRINLNTHAMIPDSFLRSTLLFQSVRFNFGRIRILILMPIYLAVNGCGQVAPRKDPVTSDGVNQIFMRSLNRQIAVGKEMQSILNVEQADLSMTSGSMRLLSEQIQHLNSRDKAKLMLMYLIVFEFDGEKAETLGNFLGDDRARVGGALAQISDTDFRQACRNLGVSENRYRMFRRLVNRWQK